MKAASWGLAAGVALALGVACGAARPTQTSAPSRTMDAMMGRPADVHAQIDTLDADIQQQLGAHAVPAPVGADIEAARPMTMDAAAKVCTPPPSPPEACADACTLGDAICRDAEKICDLADQLPGDSWAADKCAGGKASCEKARQRCCDCR